MRLACKKRVRVGADRFGSVAGSRWRRCRVCLRASRRWETISRSKWTGSGRSRSARFPARTCSPTPANWRASANWHASRPHSTKYVMPSSHRPPAGRDKTVLSASCLTWRCEFDIIAIGVFRLQFSVGDSLELSGIQLTPPKRTRHRQDSFVVFCRV